jgi:hypothetical protein
MVLAGDAAARWLAERRVEAELDCLWTIESFLPLFFWCSGIFLSFFIEFMAIQRTRHIYRSVDQTENLHHSTLVRMGEKSLCQLNKIAWL